MTNKNIDFTNPVFISIDTTVLTALEQMNTVKRKLLIVVDGVRFISVLSIGDIQRAIINKYDLNKSIQPILRNIITVCLDTDSTESIKEKMLLHRAECMPILNKENNLVNIFFWEDIFGLQEARK